MKNRIRILIIVLAAIMLLCSCGPDKDALNQKYAYRIWSEFTDQQCVDYLNETMLTNYESLDQALNKQISIYEADGSTVNLCRVCKVSYVIWRKQPQSMHDNIIQYFGELFDKMAQDKETYKYINDNWYNLFEGFFIYDFMGIYLSELYDGGMKDKFRDVAGNLESYISNPLDIVMTVAESSGKLLKKDNAADDDIRFIMDVLLELDKRSFPDNYLWILAGDIYKCADRLGETELAQEYKQKSDDLEEKEQASMLAWAEQGSLKYLNEKWHTDYESTEQALNEQISIYEAKSSNDNLCKVCFVMFLSPQPPSNDMIIQYYGGLFDKMAQDKETYEYLNNNFDDLLGGSLVNSISHYMSSYLRALYDSGMKDEFKNTASNLELFISNPGNELWTFEQFLINHEDVTDDEVRVVMNALLQYEQKYADKADTGFQMLLVFRIYYCADKLGETELAAEYKQKHNDLKKEWEDQKVQNGN